ncbi:MAG: pyrroline-5-carboxylate reductase [Proteobacteria bacterium]|nr:pyrroline-5-carboxylate reductase [Pseudomonadota bacterium]
MARPEAGLKIALVGCGSMGSALLKGWLSLPHLETFWVISPREENVEPFLGDPRVHWISSPQDLPQTPDAIVFAVKPFLLEDILPLYQSLKTLILSVAAGKPLSFYETYFPECPIVRVMPNLPVSLHQGVLGLLANEQVRMPQEAKVEMCFQKLGFCLWVNSDEEIDKLTALSGSGPAYVFYLMESLAEAAQALGFEEKQATSLALQIFVGASLTAQTSEFSPAVLRQHVTSAKGTTAAAIQVLEKGEVKALITTAVRAAFDRAQELGKQ